MRDLVIEQFLNKMGCKYSHTKSLPFAKIDLKASGENPARVYRKLDKDRAETYGIAMLDGDDFPAIVVLNHERPHNGMDWIVGTGMHRIEGAIMAERDSFEAYLVIEPDLNRREILFRMLNIPVGIGMTVQEVIGQLLWLNENQGTSFSQLAKEYHVKPNTLLNAAAEQKARMRVRHTGWDFDKSKIGATSIIALGSIHSDPVFDKAVDFVCTYPGVKTDEIKELVGEVRKQRDEASQMAVVDKHRELAEKRLAMTTATRGKPRPSKITSVAKHMKILINLLDRPLNELHVASYADMAALLLVIESAQDAIKRLRTEAERVERMSRPPQPELRKGGSRPGTQPEAHP